MQPRSGILHLKHAFRVGIALLVAIVGLVLGRSLFVPESWGRYGAYRGDNLDEQKNQAMRHGGDEACATCHRAQFDTRAHGAHLAVRCEVCHAAMATHATSAGKTAGMRIEKSVDLCATCHHRLVARPADFPQVDPRQHVEGWGMRYSEQVCFACHSDPHKPL